jgi:uncharacterized damage-inducible protein DinB
MITRDWCRLMAAYNSEMNRRLYGAASRLDDAARRQDRGAFFGSIQGTFSHLMWGDAMWMSRFDGWERPAGGIKDSPKLHADFDAMRTARVAADARIEAWADRLDAAQLAAEFTWFSGATNRSMTMPLWIPAAHMFNHQTHHRGQVHALLTAAGVTPADTDLPWVVDLPALGLLSAA